MAKKKPKGSGSAPIGIQVEEFVTITEAKDSPGPCGQCERPIASVPYFVSGDAAFCCADCRNESRLFRGYPAIPIHDGDGSRPRLGSGHSLDRAEAIFVPVRCPTCGSQKRTKFAGNVRRVPTSGRSPITGERYNVVLFRQCKCKDCGQALSVKSFEWNPEQEELAEQDHDRRRQSS